MPPIRAGTKPVAERPNLQREAAWERPLRPVSLQDLELVERAKAGHAEAFAELVAKYQDRVFNACLRICGHREDARDLTQDAFLKVFQALSTFRAESSFYTWLFRVAVNQALSHRRSSRRRREVSSDGHLELAGTQAERLGDRSGGRAFPAADEALEQAELMPVVAKALESLDDDHRAVVVLRDVEGFDYQEIGLILDLAPGTVKSRLHRARAELRKTLAPHWRAQRDSTV